MVMVSGASSTLQTVARLLREFGTTVARMLQQKCSASKNVGDLARSMRTGISIARCRDTHATVRVTLLFEA